MVKTTVTTIKELKDILSNFDEDLEIYSVFEEEKDKYKYVTLNVFSFVDADGKKDLVFSNISEKELHGEI
ncbi:MAG: hypothetical protein JKY54_02845 [Flavobacteriales bacterium]|nr:hypothetical protein [Flavobacteriales bacterium]